MLLGSKGIDSGSHHWCSASGLCLSLVSACMGAIGALLLVALAAEIWGVSDGGESQPPPTTHSTSIEEWRQCVIAYDLWAFDDNALSIPALFRYADHEAAVTSMSESCKEALETELVRRQMEPSVPDLPVTRTPRSTPTPWPTPTPSPLKVVCLTCNWAQEVRSLEARIANECTDTPERAANPYECSAMQQVISLRQSNLGKTRAGVPVYTFLLGDSMLHREVTMAEAEEQLLQSPSWRDGQQWLEVMDLIEEYEKTEGKQ